MSRAYTLTWDSYKKHIHDGFSDLQQREEFVDMTLAADGYLVKVHKTLLALASPYIREMLQSAPCNNPVLFLNGVNREVLSHILEYIYTGEVHVPNYLIRTFLQVSKTLHIIGLKDVMTPGVSTHTFKNDKIKQRNLSNAKNNVQNMATYSNMETDNVELQQESLEINVTNVETNNISSIAINELSEIEALENNFGASCINEGQNELNIDVEQELSQYHLNNTQIIPSAFVEDSTDGNAFTDNYEPEAKHNISIEDCELVSNNAEENDPVTSIPNVIIGTGNNKITIKPLFNQNHSTEAQLDTNNDETLDSNDGINVDWPISNMQAEVPPVSNPKNIHVGLNYTNEAQKQYPAITIDADGGFKIKTSTSKENVGLEMPSSSGNVGSTALYMVTNRGNLMLILNRYMYYVHHRSNNGKKRRWRCVDYRKLRCQAYVETVGERITTRKFSHCHTLHDGKIMKKSNKAMFSTIATAEGDTRFNPKCGLRRM